jgi:hypothetical protein
MIKSVIVVEGDGTLVGPDVGPDVGPGVGPDVGAGGPPFIIFIPPPFPPPFPPFIIIIPPFFIPLPVPIFAAFTFGVFGALGVLTEFDIPFPFPLELLDYLFVKKHEDNVR